MALFHEHTSALGLLGAALVVAGVAAVSADKHHPQPPKPGTAGIALGAKPPHAAGAAGAELTPRSNGLTEGRAPWQVAGDSIDGGSGRRTRAPAAPATIAPDAACNLPNGRQLSVNGAVMHSVAELGPTQQGSEQAAVPAATTVAAAAAAAGRRSIFCCTCCCRLEL